VCEFLEKHYKEGLSNEDGLKLVVKALLDVVESGNKNIEVIVIGKNETRLLLDDEIEKLIEIAKQ
jgi:20S proteasome subunit alpha 4